MSSEFIFTDGVLTGEKIDGQFIPLPPALTGDDLDLLLDQCCSCIENLFKNDNRLDAELRMSDGQHSHVLTDGETLAGIRRGHKGLRSWITSGTLRDSNQLTPVLNAFLQAMRTKQRLRKVDPDWEFDNDCLIVISSRFGIDAPRTIAELQAKREVERIERGRTERERRERTQAAHKAFVASEEGQEQARLRAIAEFKEDTIRVVVNALVLPTGTGRSKVTAEMNDEKHDTAVRQANADARATMKECRRVEAIVRPVVMASPLSADAIVRIYEDTWELWVEMTEDIPSEVCPPFEAFVNKQFTRFVEAANIPARLEPFMVPPLMEGVDRHLFENTKDYCDFFTQQVTPDQMSVCRVDNSGNIVVDVMPDSLKAAYDQFVAFYEASRKEEEQ